MEVVRLIQSLERQSHAVTPMLSRAPEKSSICLVEAHDWMGPDNRDSQPEPKDVLLKTDRRPK